MIAASGQRAVGWEAGRTPWNVEFHLWCDEVSERLVELAKRSTRVRAAAYAKSCGLSVTVDSGGVPVAGEFVELEAQDALLEWGVAPVDGFALDQALWSQVVWAARSAATEAAERKAKASAALTGTELRILAPKPGQSPGGVWDSALNAEGRAQFDQMLAAATSDVATSQRTGATADSAKAELAEYLDGGTAVTTVFFAIGDKTDEDPPQSPASGKCPQGGAPRLRLGVDTGLLSVEVSLADHPQWGQRFAWLLRHAGLAMRAWHNEQVAELMVDAPQLTDHLEGQQVVLDPLALPAAPDWPDDGLAAREAFLASVETRFWFEEPKMESLTAARREGDCA